METPHLSIPTRRLRTRFPQLFRTFHLRTTCRKMDDLTHLPPLLPSLRDCRGTFLHPPLLHPRHPLQRPPNNPHGRRIRGYLWHSCRLLPHRPRSPHPPFLRHPHQNEDLRCPLLHHRSPHCPLQLVQCRGLSRPPRRRSLWPPRPKMGSASQIHCQTLQNRKPNIPSKIPKKHPRRHHHPRKNKALFPTIPTRNLQRS